MKTGHVETSNIEPPTSRWTDFHAKPGRNADIMRFRGLGRAIIHTGRNDRTNGMSVLGADSCDSDWQLPPGTHRDGSCHVIARHDRRLVPQDGGG
jgi:hypothetical protein